VPVAIDLGVLMLAVLACIVAYGGLLVYRGTFKLLLVALADIFDAISIPIPTHAVKPFGTLAAWLRSAAAAIDHALAQIALDAEGGVVMLWHGLAQQVQWLGQVIGDGFEIVERRLQRLVLSTIPAQFGTLRRQLAHTIGVLRAAVASGAAAVELELARLRRGIDRTAARLERVIAAKAAAVAGRVGQLERTTRGELTRLRRIEGTLTKAGAAALVGVALARLGLGWLRCPRVAKLGKRACGMDASLLDSLLADTLVIAGTVSLIEFAREMQDVTARSEGLIRRFWRAA